MYANSIMMPSPIVTPPLCYIGGAGFSVICSVCVPPCMSRACSLICFLCPLRGMWPTLNSTPGSFPSTVAFFPCYSPVSANLYSSSRVASWPLLWLMLCLHNPLAYLDDLQLYQIIFAS